MLDVLVGLQGWIQSSINEDLSAFALTRSWSALLFVLPLGIAFGADAEEVGIINRAALARCGTTRSPRR